tara:strand:- start:27223 stop:28677 length:1455 start_codon:yes stop_codon:yes gene_type:complete
MLKTISILCLFSITGIITKAQTLPDSMFVSIPAGTFIMGEPESEYVGPPGSYDTNEHSVTLTAFKMSKTEISNTNFVEFLNAAYSDGLLKVEEFTGPGPDNGALLVSGSASAPDDYKGFALINLNGTRVMKDHNNEDGDNDPFTGEIEPENPLNLSYIGFNDANDDHEKFYIKDPKSTFDFDWQELTNYYNYSSTTNQDDTSILLNDYSKWPELVDYPTNMPSLEDVSEWPVTFVRWYGAKAYAMYYAVNLPTEAQWEYAAKGGSSFKNSTPNGDVNHDGTSANWSWVDEDPAQHHVLDVMNNDPNPFGLYNMGGNVWEWCEDWYSSDFYRDGVTDPLNTDATSDKKVRRGGSWNYHESTLKTAYRDKDEKFKGNDHFGFRVVDNILSTSYEFEDEPTEFSVSQNYPNPFNPSTQISYVLPEASHVKLDIINMLGQLVETLVNEGKTSGSYTVSFDAAGLSSGVYFYTIQAGAFTQTKRMLLIK